MSTKSCICCGKDKPIEDYHLHKKMKGGRINKCKVCVLEYVSKWRKENPDSRHKYYESEIARGKRSVKKRIKVGGEFIGSNPRAKRKTQIKYIHKKLFGGRVYGGDLTDFVMDEAVSLCQERSATTGIKWSVDHIVPRGSRIACGLHIWANIQVAPLSWNARKRHVSMDTFFPNHDSLLGR